MWQQELFDKIEQANRSVLFYSGGFDSSILLETLRQQPKDFDIFQDRILWTREQLDYVDQVIREQDLRVFSFPPTNAYFVGEGRDLSLIFEYPQGVPIIKDVVEGTQCIADMESYRSAVSPFKWDLCIVGSRQDDTHWLFPNQMLPAKEWQANGCTFYAPLFDVKRETVLRMAQEMEIKASPPMDLELCTKCLNGTGKVMCPKENELIDSIVWDRELNTKYFRERYAR